MDNVYGHNTPDTLICNVMAMAKKLGNLKKIDHNLSIDVFISERAIGTCRTGINYICENLKKEGLKVELKEVVRIVTISKSASGDGHYEIGGGINGRVSDTTTTTIKGIALKIP